MGHLKPYKNRTQEPISASPDLDSQPSTLPVTVTKPVTNQEFSKATYPHDTKQVFGEPLTVGAEPICYLFFSVNYFFFLLSYSRPPGGCIRSKKSASQLVDDAHRNQVSLKEALRL